MPLAMPLAISYYHTLLRHTLRHMRHAIDDIILDINIMMRHYFH
jgi:hypothetical protein